MAGTAREKCDNGVVVLFFVFSSCACGWVTRKKGGGKVKGFAKEIMTQ